jgi:anaerobic ribonucleoside-triphosphate reductase activating protein
VPDFLTEVDLKDFCSRFDFTSIEGVTITGGEPFMQVEELAKLVRMLAAFDVEDILVYTGYTHKELLESIDENIHFILNNIAVLIDGPFDIGKATDSSLCGSSNQNVIILNTKYADIYNRYFEGGRMLNILKLANNEVHFVGIPPSDYVELYSQYLNVIKMGLT